MAYNKDNSGSVSKNDRKEKDAHPDIRGKATIGGVEYWIDGWRKETDGRKWYSLAFKPKEAKVAEKPQLEMGRRTHPASDEPDEIPF